MQLKLYEPMQENDYYFKGYVSLKELSQLFSDYEFPEETLEKAAIHKKNMLQGISSFTAVLRMDPDSRTEVSEDMIVFTSTTFRSATAQVKSLPSARWTHLSLMNLPPLSASF